MKLTLAQINDEYNRRIKSITEPEGGDEWQTPARTIMRLEGDCEDYAIAKLYTMIWAGYPAFDINIHCVRLKGEFYGQGKGTLINHAFVCYEGWVLDNYNPHIVQLGNRLDIKETYAIINAELPNKYAQWNKMLSERDPELDTKLIENFFYQTLQANLA